MGLYGGKQLYGVFKPFEIALAASIVQKLESAVATQIALHAERGGPLTCDMEASAFCDLPMVCSGVFV